MSVDKQQFQLPLTVDVGRPRRSVVASRERAARPLPVRVAGIDQVLSTRDVEQITGKHRCTIYPLGVRRHVSAQTRRSDIERWLNGAG